jgi:hypothetical protein
MTACKYATTAGTKLPTWDKLPSRQAAKNAGVSKSTVNDHRAGKCLCTAELRDVPKHITTGESETHNADGTSNYVR